MTEMDSLFLKYVMPGIPEDDAAVFFAPTEKISIDEPPNLLWQILAKCDGKTAASEIVELFSSNYPDFPVQDIISDLISIGILSDANSLGSYFHRFTNNPAEFERSLTAHNIAEITSRPYRTESQGKRVDLQKLGGVIAGLSLKRESVRQFSDKMLPAAFIGELFSNAYDFRVKPVPSAGALYPLKLYGIIKADRTELDEGYYEYNPHDNSLIQISGQIPDKYLDFVLNTDSSLHNAPFIIVISADLNRHPEKYSNRGYRYTLLEAGHVAQNIHLTATELGIGSLEYGGFRDDEVAEELNHEGHVSPLILVGIGFKSDTNIEVSSQIEARLEAALVGPDKPIDWVSVQTKGEMADNLEFYFATAKYKKPSDFYQDHHNTLACGTATSISMSRIKAIAEAYERYISGQFKFDIMSTANNLPGPWLHPSSVRPKNNTVHDNHLIDFHHDLNLQWLKANSPTGKELYVPVDLVLYPLHQNQLGRKKVAEADSSGVAAHVDKDAAIRRAVYELIERDALMRIWFEKRSPDQLSSHLLGRDMLRKVKKWEQLGFSVNVLDISQNGIPVVMVTIKNLKREYPYFVNGASASNSYSEAIGKAMEEAELGLVDALTNSYDVEVDYTEVYSPEEHGLFYLNPKNFHRISWLLEGKVTGNRQRLEVDEIDVIAKFDPFIVNLTPEGAPLFVVRAVIPQLVPINFGIGTEYRRHPFAPPFIDPSRQAPHFFA